MEALTTVIVALIASSGFWTFLIQFQDNRQKNQQEILERIEQNLQFNHSLTIAMGRNTVNQLCNRFIELEYIPKEEYVAFKSCGDAYIAAGGNTEVKEKFEYIIENYKIK